MHSLCLCYVLLILAARNKTPGKSKEEHMREKKQELEKRLQDVSGQLGQPPKKSVKKGKLLPKCISTQTHLKQVRAFQN